MKKDTDQRSVSFSGAGDRGRTDTVSLPLDFESSTSANSITPANKPFSQHLVLYHSRKIKSRAFEKKIKIYF